MRDAHRQRTEVAPAPGLLAPRSRCDVLAQLDPIDTQTDALELADGQAI
jgi:hypothetical protein